MISDSGGQVVGSAMIGQRFAGPQWCAGHPSAADYSPAYAYLQVDRVAAVRHLPVQQVRDLVQHHVQQPIGGFMGDARVNVLELNLALARLSGGGS